MSNNRQGEQPQAVGSQSAQTPLSMNGHSNTAEKGPMRSLSDEPPAALITDSPSKAKDGLERFAQAKADIRSAFDNIKNVLAQMQRGLQEWIVPENQHDADSLKTQVAGALQKAQDLDQAVARDAMKVVFVGLTSAGKSTSINAVLRSRVLPSGFGQTTNRFINLHPTREATARLVDASTGKQYELPELQELANALSDMHEGDDDEDDADISDPLDLYWPTSACEVLRNDLVILDSPGLRFNKKFDDWIDHTASDADVFVLVVNGEMALGREATEFFEQVRRKFSKPNVFVLFNRWELAPKGQRCDRSRKQLLGLAKRLLVDTLDLIPQSEVSQHALAFSVFEEEFALATSRHAIDTRFHSKVVEGLEVVRECEGVMRTVVEALDGHLERRNAKLKSAVDKLNKIQAKLPDIVERAASIAHTVPDKVQRYMHTKMTEILSQRLQSIVDDFMSLSDFEDEESIELEKQELSTHVESQLQVELNDSCAPHVQQLYSKAFTDITALFKELLPENSSPERYVQMAFRSNMTLDCTHLPENFHEDLAFHFSWGWQSLGAFVPDAVRLTLETFTSDLFSRFSLSYKRAFRSQANRAEARVEDDAQALDSAPSQPRRLTGRLSRFAFDVAYICWDITTHTPYGLMVAASLPYAYRLVRRPMIRNLIGGCIFVYTATYAYEYMSFTTAAKERLFRQQFAAHAQEKLKVTASSRARDAKDSIQLDLSETQQKLADAVEQHKAQLQTTIADLRNTVERTKNALCAAQDLKSSVSQQHLKLVSLKDKYFQE
ncbi:hypothetical protein PTSG_09484 [Salpingoeca rosetta]|uniref:Dynamin-type G domain-containing protein n=1 Tax=Salpingoeca rosetta (strain ATCC 50818 / BSB-021) TaxID=946362 RepID=F2UL52_SALR5|nr:uncharacterized protein PTSG_09484 [Salpingoeca rosetta]EGD77851.1 hypothetical protein PTSG_09484 [Salpingoeca rosetta]|eukprot:XP_004989915.1 hypothetical protein PTSG_09484 [Salpingoeca rosetta]